MTLPDDLYRAYSFDPKEEPVDAEDARRLELRNGLLSYLAAERVPVDEAIAHLLMLAARIRGRTTCCRKHLVAYLSDTKAPLMDSYHTVALGSLEDAALENLAAPCKEVR